MFLGYIAGICALLGLGAGLLKKYELAMGFFAGGFFCGVMTLYQMFAR